MHTKTTRYGGWPMVPSTKYPAELTIQCPHCKGTNITLTGDYGYTGTGPDGRGRLGDSGSTSYALCETCKARGYLP